MKLDMTSFRIISKWFIFRNPNALHAGEGEKLENEHGLFLSLTLSYFLASLKSWAIIWWS